MDFKIPETFVLGSDFFESVYSPQIIDKLKILAETQDHKVQLNSLKEEIITKLDTLDFSFLAYLPKTVSKYAVRSSTSIEDGEKFSFAGRFKSELNVSFKFIKEAIYQVWLSQFNECAIYYLKSTSENLCSVRMSIIIQEMIEAEISGAMFTINPVSGNKEEVIIEYVYGCGEGLMSGSKTPISLVYSKTDCKLISENIPELYTENDRIYDFKNIHIPKLLEIGKEIEKLNNQFPVDIEWCTLGDEVFCTWMNL